MLLPRICRTLKTFKHFYLSEHEERVVNNNLHRRRAITLAREEALVTLLDRFYQLGRDEQLSSVIKTCFDIGSISKVVSKTTFFINNELVDLENTVDE